MVIISHNPPTNIISVTVSMEKLSQSFPSLQAANPWLTSQPVARVLMFTRIHHIYFMTQEKGP